jgi:hypothetical protein
MKDGFVNGTIISCQYQVVGALNISVGIGKELMFVGLKDK